MGMGVEANRNPKSFPLSFRTTLFTGYYLKTACGYLMQPHLYNGLARRADYSIFAW